MQEEFESTDAETLSSFLYQLVHDSASITVQLAGDICSTVPFCLGFSLKNSQAPKMKHFPMAITGCHLVWPLYIATRTEFGPEMREWAISRLRGISENMGIKQAMVVADSVANNEDFLS
jgi:branched-subunit amino acid ABC-type transport system permease component